MACPLPWRSHKPSCGGSWLLSLPSSLSPKGDKVRVLKQLGLRKSVGQHGLGLAWRGLPEARRGPAQGPCPSKVPSSEIPVLVGRTAQGSVRGLRSHTVWASFRSAGTGTCVVFRNSRWRCRRGGRPVSARRPPLAPRPPMFLSPSVVIWGVLGAEARARRGSSPVTLSDGGQRPP